jgi:hypothetical protein
VSAARVPIPATPAALLDAATRLDRFWAEMRAAGYVKPTLEEELALRERQTEGAR